MAEDQRLTLRRYDSIGGHNILERMSIQRAHEHIAETDRPVITLPYETSMKRALEILSGSNIRCAPVVDEGGQMLGLVDKLDIVSFLLTQYYVAGEPNEDTTVEKCIGAFKSADTDGKGTLDNAGVMKALDTLGMKAEKAAVEDILPEIDINKNGLIEIDEFIALVRRLEGVDTRHVFDTPVNEAIGVSATNTLVCVQHTKPLWPVVQRMAQSLPRVVVTDSDTSDVRGFLSQTGMLRYLVEENLLGPCRTRTVADAKLDQEGHQLVSLRTKDLAHQAFMQIFESSIPGVVVLDDSDRLVDTFSDSNSKSIAPEHLCDLFLTVEHFLEKAVAKSPTKGGNVASVRPEDTIEAVARKLVGRHLHAITVVDGDGRALATITLTDILLEVVDGYEQEKRNVVISSESSEAEGSGSA